jgi:hypothetical protein
MTAVRYLACPTRMAGENGHEFVDRMLRELSSRPKGATLPPIEARKPASVKVDDDGRPTTKKWPPPIGSRYVGKWPPKFITPSTGRCARTKPLPLDAEQAAWKARIEGTSITEGEGR